MATWDKLKPDGAVTVGSLVDDLIVENNKAIEDAIAKEHDFATGAGQTGRHTFGYGTVGARNGIAELEINGAFWVLTGGAIPAGFGELVLRDETGLQWLDASGRQFLQLTNKWTAAQRSEYVALGASGSVTPDWADSNFFKSTLTGPLTINNPTNKPAANDAGTFLYELTQGGGGGHTLTLGAAYKTAFGLAPILTVAAGAVDVLVCTLLSGGNIYAELIQDIK